MRNAYPPIGIEARILGTKQFFSLREEKPFSGNIPFSHSYRKNKGGETKNTEKRNSTYLGILTLYIVRSVHLFLLNVCINKLLT